MTGTVVRNTGSWYVVHTPEGDLNCKIKGNFRLKGLRCTNPVAVGDNVTVELRGDGSCFIVEIAPRKNYIIRRASNLSKEFQIIAANVDRALLVVTLAFPETNTTFIDRFLATAEAYDVPATIIINKVDLLTQGEERQLLQAVSNLYRTIGYDVLHTSTLTGEGISSLKEIVKDKTSLISGNSGVGKSSIINCLVPDARLRTGEVSDVHRTGMHTTTFSEMLDVPTGGKVIDTPGVKGFGTIDFNRNEVAHYFPEIFSASARCKYGNCTHTHEPGCAVRDAVEQHFISESRYASYLSILGDDPDDKYRKAF
ncbi:MAG: ribosome small subunit-dependent GTPase A [Muribaculaceae bacterium]|nr:ribosome small subunit-dependent GTPase A [Muribaculaceae bacterium]